jgi:hypothetical protein
MNELVVSALIAIHCSAHTLLIAKTSINTITTQHMEHCNDKDNNLQSFAVIMQSNSSLSSDEMYPRTPSKTQSVNNLMHSSIDFDQMIVTEADLIQDSIQGSGADNEAIQSSLSKIRLYAEENSKNARKARTLVREMYVL